ncbi:expressed secreted protein of unknown function [Candidatus Velamenicoccus archaeovorus]|uniref:Uncharacterized protein n=1 Tax=Velamenicoccus archaeovorus TaxID=1930593 RepID=A0A410P2R1_VELA1|nr:hypothetical protein [Candidatus Velamenicoccus archaeovorus]QAT16410.1 expressed secreted protein of unknown function [Candidatus Velamenicoccus archaeovorus]
MKIKGLVLAITIIVVFIAGVGVGDWLASAGYQSLIARMQGQEMILKAEVEKYKNVIRDISATVVKAMPAEKVSQEAGAAKGR